MPFEIPIPVIRSSSEKAVQGPSQRGAALRVAAVGRWSSGCVRKSMIRPVTILASLMAFSPHTGFAQQPTPSIRDMRPEDAARVLFATVRQRQEERLRDIHDFTFVEETDGRVTTVYYERRMVDGQATFVAERSDEGIAAAGPGTSPPPKVGPTGLNFPNGLDRNARVEGMEIVDGNETYRVRVEPLDEVDLGVSLPESEGSTRFTSATFLIDADEYVPRRLTLEGDKETMGTRVPVTLEVELSDYREIEGLLHPFRRTTVVTVAPLMSAKDRKGLEEAREQFEQMEKELAKLPEAQRRMIEAQVVPGLQQLEAMMGAGATEVTSTTETKEVRVNAGPPTEIRAAGAVATSWNAELTGVMSYSLEGSLAVLERRPGLMTITLSRVTAEGIQPTSVIRIEVVLDRLAVGDMTGYGSVEIRGDDGSKGTFVTEPGAVGVTITAVTEGGVNGRFELEATGTVMDRLGQDGGSVVVFGQFDAVVLNEPNG